MWATEQSFTIVFKDNGGTGDGSTARTSISDIISSGDTYVSSLTASKVYNAKSGYGLKIGASGGGGSLTLNLNSALKLTKIEYNAAQYKSTEKSITVNGSTEDNLAADITQYTVNCDGKTKVSAITFTPAKRAYLAQVKVYYDDTPDHVENVDDMLINYPTAKTGITVSGTSAEDGSLKIHSNTDNVTGYTLSNGYTTDGVLNANYILLETEGGFKKGDIVTINGAINANDGSKRATAVLFTSEGVGETTTTIKQFDDFVNGYSSADDPEEQTFILNDDYDKLYLGRDGNTKTLLMTIMVGRPQTVKVLFTDATWTSFSSDRAVQAPEGVTVYYASASSGGTVTLSEIANRKIPANEGVVLHGTAGVKDMTVIASIDALAGNLLKPHVKESDAKSAEYYTLAVDGSKNPIFKKSNGSGTLAAGKSYLDLTTSAHELVVNFGDATGIQAVDTSKASNNHYFNLAGQQVAQPIKGLYIVNGKKVIIK